jgi:hypothetical protein
MSDTLAWTLIAAASIMYMRRPEVVMPRVWGDEQTHHHCKKAAAKHGLNIHHGLDPTLLNPLRWRHDGSQPIVHVNGNSARVLDLPVRDLENSMHFPTEAP